MEKGKERQRRRKKNPPITVAHLMECSSEIWPLCHYGRSVQSKNRLIKFIRRCCWGRDRLSLFSLCLIIISISFSLSNSPFSYFSHFTLYLVASLMLHFSLLLFFSITSSFLSFFDKPSLFPFFWPSLVSLFLSHTQCKYSVSERNGAVHFDACVGHLEVWTLTAAVYRLKCWNTFPTNCSCMKWVLLFTLLFWMRTKSKCKRYKHLAF